MAQTPKPDPITIGFSIVATDPAGRPALKAARLAVDIINKSAGSHGKKVNLLVDYLPNRDYAFVDKSISTMINKGVSAILSSGGSGVTIKVSEKTIQKNIVLISGSSSSPRISKLKDNNLVWRTIPSDVFQGKIAAKIIDSLGSKSVGIMYINNPYGKGLAEICTAELQKRGKSKVKSVFYEEQQDYAATNFTSQLKELFMAKPEVIYLISYGEDGAKIVNQSYNNGFITDTYKPTIIGCDANYNNDFLLGVESTSRIEGMLGLIYTHPRGNKEFTSFMEQYSTFNEPQDSADLANASLATLLNVEATSAYAANAFDAIFTVVLASISAKSNDGQKIAAEIPLVTKNRTQVEKISFLEYEKAASILQKGVKINYDGCSGPIEFDENGDVQTGNYQLWKVSKGSFSLLQVIHFTK